MYPMKLLQQNAILKPINRLHHVYRPIQYTDWVKPPGEFYYRLMCPLKPKPPKPRSKVIVAKECKICSFWQQMKDNCCGFFWPIPPMPRKPRGRMYVVEDLRPKTLTEEMAQSLLQKKSFRMHECAVPPCPEYNWQVLRPLSEQ